MLVEQLIEELKKCPPRAAVRFFVAPDDKRSVRDVSPEDSDGGVLLGDNLPAEQFARDYKYD